jgi:hypothetical protein
MSDFEKGLLVGVFVATPVMTFFALLLWSAA